MKRIIKFLSYILIISIILVGCSSNVKDDNNEKESTDNLSSGGEIALITGMGDIDDKSFNQGSWEGVVQYAEENNITYKYYKPSEESDDACLAAIDLAIKAGAKVVIASGFAYEVPIYMAQDTYPDVHFILVDGKPHNPSGSEYRTNDNTVTISYAEEQAGFLVGYASVVEGMDNLGFMGGKAVPAVVRFGYGFVQGIDYAAKELGVKNVEVSYYYTGAFQASPEAQAMAASWYNYGVKAIFSCGGPVGNSVMAAAEQSDSKVIGVDVDQSSESDTVITSAAKGIKVSVYDSISSYYNNEFKGGTTQIYGAENNGIELPMETSRFEKFNMEDYKNIYEKLANGSIEVDNDINKSIQDLKLENIKITEVK